jgi:hypothetical protein
MAERMSNATRNDDLDDAARQYPSTVINKYRCKITQERAGDADDDHSGVVGRQRIEKTGTCPIPKESEYHPRNNHAHEESGTTTKYSGISEKNLVGDAESKEMDNKRKDDNGDDDGTPALAMATKTIGSTTPRKTTTTMITQASAMAKKTIGLSTPRKSIQKMKSSTTQTIHKHKQKKQSTTSMPWSILQSCSWLLKRRSEN